MATIAQIISELASRIEALREGDDAIAQPHAAPEGTSLRSAPLEERLQRVITEYNSRPQLSAAANEVAAKLIQLRQKRVCINQNKSTAVLPSQLRGAASSYVASDLRSASASNETEAPTVANQRKLAEDAELRKWDDLYAYSRDAYLRDISLIRTYSASASGAQARAQWKAVAPRVLSRLDATSHGLPVSAFASVHEALKRDATFQVGDETKTLDDLAFLLQSNKERTAALRHQLTAVRQQYVDVVTWANRQLCRFDMELELAEQAAAHDEKCDY